MITTSVIGHGNFAAAYAIELLAVDDGIETEFALQRTIPYLGEKIHQINTLIPFFADKYTEDSSRLREGHLAHMFGWLTYHHAVSSHAWNSPFLQERTLHIVQEHPILGASQSALDRDGYHTVRLLVPDAYPKGSGIVALKKHVGSIAMVWNVSAEERLKDAGVNVELIKPFYLDAFRPDERLFKDGGRDLVVKSSGTGMPSAWRKQIQDALSDVDEYDWAFHFKNTVHDQYGSKTIHNRKMRNQEFFDDLGGKTKLLIGYPSELVQIAIDMNSRGVPLRMIVLPPRGEHEKENMIELNKLGLLLGELRFDNKKPTLAGLHVVYPEDIPDLMRARYGNKDVSGFIGKVGYWRRVLKDSPALQGVF